MNTRISSLLLVIAVFTSGCMKVTHDHQHVHYEGKPQSSSKCMTKPGEREKLIREVSGCDIDKVSDTFSCKYNVEHVIQMDSAFKGGHITIEEPPKERTLKNTSDDLIVGMFKKPVDSKVIDTSNRNRHRELRRNEEEICIESVPGNQHLTKITYPFEKDKESHELVIYVVDTDEADANFFYYIQHTETHGKQPPFAHDESAGSGSRD